MLASQQISHLDQHQQMHLKLGLSNEVARHSKCHRGVLSVKCLGYEGIFLIFWEIGYEGFWYDIYVLSVTVSKTNQKQRECEWEFLVLFIVNS